MLYDVYIEAFFLRHDYYRLDAKYKFTFFQNGDGFISAKELGVLMRTLGRNPTEDEIMNIMNEIDVDHNGKLDFSEFTIMMRDKLSGEDMEQEIKQAFRYVKVLNS